MRPLRHLLMLGTSRLHEPAEVALQEAVFVPELLNAGYVHSVRQAEDWLRIITGRLELTEEQSRLFFRRDQTPSNPFDASVFEASGLSARVEHWRQQLAKSDGVVVEISSLKSYVHGGLHLQGNPNFYRNAPYKDVWREGYYAHFMPELGVLAHDDTVDEVHASLSSIVDMVQGRPVVVMPHLFASGESGTVRASLYDVLTDAARGLEVTVLDPRPWVDRFGFRTLDDGSTDIHHLPMTGCAVVARDLDRMSMAPQPVRTHEA